jgi:hypothetical protein
MAKAQTASTFKKRPPVNRPGIHAKTKFSKSKTSKNYRKLSRGQG